jgi:hypothetical protein
MKRIKRTTVRHHDGPIDATNYLVAVGPDYDIARDVVTITVHHVRPEVAMKGYNVADIEARYNTKVIAVVLNADDSIHDYTFNWETAQNMALQGYRIKVIASDPYSSMTVDEIQALCDAEKDRYDDCFGTEDS